MPASRIGPRGGWMPSSRVFAARFAGAACGLACVLALAGCGRKGADAVAAAGQVIAHVGPDEVTIQELENEFRWNNAPADKRDDSVVKRALSELVGRKYLMQQALAAKLDREPTVH